MCIRDSPGRRWFDRRHLDSCACLARQCAPAGPRGACRHRRDRRAGVDDRIRLRPYLEPRTSAGQRHRNHQPRRLLREPVVGDHYRRDPRLADAGLGYELLARIVPVGDVGAIRAVDPRPRADLAVPGQNPGPAKGRGPRGIRAHGQTRLTPYARPPYVEWRSVARLLAKKGPHCATRGWGWRGITWRRGRRLFRWPAPGLRPRRSRGRGGTPKILRWVALHTPRA